MTATLERTPRTTDARITGGRSEVVHTRVNATDDPIAHLTPEDIEEIGRELDEIRASVMDDLGESDARYIRRVIRTQRGLEAAGRVLLLGALAVVPGLVPYIWTRRKHGDKLFNPFERVVVAIVLVAAVIAVIGLVNGSLVLE